MTAYVFDNAWQRGRERLDAAEQLLDPGTIRLIEAIGVAEGWRCADVGAGGGSIARWLSDRVGPHGRVLATDIETRFLADLEKPNCSVIRHDITQSALPEDGFDLIHARLLLEHLPERDRAVGRLVAALKPGGRLLVEAVDYVSGVAVSALGASEHERTQAVRLRLMRAGGVDAEYGRRLPGVLKTHGLHDVETEGRVWVMEGGSAASHWFRLSMEQLRGSLVDSGGLSNHEIDRMLELFDDPEWSALTPIIMAAWGRRR
jgi:SAM-dependent methyltransferase